MNKIYFGKRNRCDLLCELTGKQTGHSGIAYFILEQERDYNIEWANEIRDGKWIRRNWEQSRTVNPYMDGVGKQIASCDGIIVEIGAGPGGYMPVFLVKLLLFSSVRFVVYALTLCYLFNCDYGYLDKHEVVR